MLKGKHTGLRAIERDDLPQLLDWRNHPEFRRYFRENRELGMDSQIAWYEKILKSQNNIMFSIVEVETTSLLGICGLCHIDWMNRNAEVSIYTGVDGSYVDEKYAPDAAQTVIRYAYGELGVHRLWVEIYDFDNAKKKLFEALGFKLEGRHRQMYWCENKWHDSLVYGLLSSEYSYPEMDLYK